VKSVTGSYILIQGLKLISIHLQLNDQYPILRVHTYFGCINTKYFYTVWCIKMDHMLTIRGILVIIFYKVCKITTVESLTSILVVLCRVIPNVSPYICEKVDHTFIVIFSGQIKVLT
jgi:hypothetical protein